MATTHDVEYTLHFTDDTTQKITVGPFASVQSLAPLKSRIITFNESFTSDTARLALSKYGAEWDKISRARIISTNTNVIY